MSLQETKEQALKLSVSDRLTLINLIIESLKNDLNSTAHQIAPLEPPFTYNSSSPIQDYSGVEQADLIYQLRGFLKTDKPAPTDAEVQTMLEERIIEKYL